jgi:hypothetical protein
MGNYSGVAHPLHTDKDPDRVEQANVSRQAFDAADVGRFKSEVLAERLSRRFGGQVSYSVLPTKLASMTWRLESQATSLWSWAPLITRRRDGRSPRL